MILRVVLPVLGAAAVLIAFTAAGGDLGDWPTAAAVAVPVAAVLVPAVVAALLARRDGAFDAVLWGLLTVAAEVVLVFGVGFGLLGLGPG
jgi:hypothetical protein